MYEREREKEKEKQDKNKGEREEERPEDGQRWGRQRRPGCACMVQPGSFREVGHSRAGDIIEVAGGLDGEPWEDFDSRSDEETNPSMDGRRNIGRGSFSGRKRREGGSGWSNTCKATVTRGLPRSPVTRVDPMPWRFPVRCRAFLMLF